VRNSMKFVLVEKVDQVFEAALTAAGKPAARKLAKSKPGRNGRTATKKAKNSGKPLKKKSSSGSNGKS